MSVFDSLSPTQQNLIKKHLELVEIYNNSTNLTRIDKDNAFDLHIEDSLAALPFLNTAPKGIYADLGTGGGFPGIPLAIATGRKTHLIDYRVKKINILNSIVSQLNLSDTIQGIPMRAELLAKKHPNSYSVITARAVSKLSVLLELSSPLLKQNGVLICYKGQLEDSEFNTSIKVCKIVGMTHLDIFSYDLCEQYKRNLVLFKKNRSPKIKLPRREGQAQKTPLQ